MKQKVPGHGRSRDEGPAGRAGPRRNIPAPIPSSDSQLPFPAPIPPGRIATPKFKLDSQLIFFMKSKFLSGSARPEI